MNLYMIHITAPFDMTFHLIFSVLHTQTDTFASIADSDETARHQPSHQDLHCLPFCFWLFYWITYLEKLTFPNSINERVYLRNSGVKGVKNTRRFMSRNLPSTSLTINWCMYYVRYKCTLLENIFMAQSTELEETRWQFQNKCIVNIYFQQLYAGIIAKTIGKMYV